LQESRRYPYVELREQRERNYKALCRILQTKKAAAKRHEEDVSRKKTQKAQKKKSAGEK
jgi:hypothetical protein